MALAHPERERDSGLEPTVGDQLRLREFLLALEKASEGELRELCGMMARQLMIVYPATVRYLAREAARNLASESWSSRRSEELLTAFLADQREEK